MFSEIFGYRQGTPWQIYSLITCSVVVTAATLVFPNLQHVFGSFGDDTGLIQRLTIPFQHGFDELSAIIHLLTHIALISILGLFIWKVAGSRLFFMLTFSSMLIYILLHQLLGMTGHGGTGYIWSYAPIAVYALNEGRLIKTRSVFDDFYRSMRFLMVILFTVFPILLAVIPIYFNKEMPIYQSFLLGNIFLVSATLWGFVFSRIYKEQIRERLKQFARKKKFETLDSDRSEFLFASVYPFLIILGFLLVR